MQVLGLASIFWKSAITRPKEIALFLSRERVKSRIELNLEFELFSKKKKNLQINADNKNVFLNYKIISRLIDSELVISKVHENSIMLSIC